MDERDWRRAAPLARTTLRGRDDWTQHFFVSAALTVLSAQAPSDAIGLFKEELDAGGGSGFSVGDLLADRAGTTFALLATQDDAAARSLQTRLAAGFRVNDFFPEAADLPENIQAAELEARYGGTGGLLFRQYAAEVERRLWSCPGYWGLRPRRLDEPAHPARLMTLLRACHPGEVCIGIANPHDPADTAPVISRDVGRKAHTLHSGGEVRGGLLLQEGRATSPSAISHDGRRGW
jgi:hypothetical protein